MEKKYRLKNDLPGTPKGTLSKFIDLMYYFDGYKFTEYQIVSLPDWFELIGKPKEEVKLVLEKLENGYWAAITTNPYQYPLSVKDLEVMQSALNGELYTKEEMNDFATFHYNKGYDFKEWLAKRKNKQHAKQP